MKIIDSKGRLFGKLNIVDFIVLLAVGAIIIGGVWTLFGKNIKEVATTEVEMTTTMRVKGNFIELFDQLEKSDQRLVSGSSFVPGEIVSIKTEPYYTLVTTSDGKIVQALDPIKVDCVVVIKSKVTKGTPTPKIGNQEIRVGKNYILKTQTCEFIALIESVVFSE